MSNAYVELLYMLNSHTWTTIPLPFIKNLLNHLVSHLMKARELQENLLNDMERFSSEEESSQTCYSTVRQYRKVHRSHETQFGTFL